MNIELPVCHDIWMDNGLETFYRILKEAEDDNFTVKIGKDSLEICVDDFAEFRQTVEIMIKNRRSSLVVVAKDKKTGETREIKKDYILIQEKTKDKSVKPWRVIFKEELYNTKTTGDIVNRIFDLIGAEGTRSCVICGRYFSKPIKKLQQAAYPFVTKIKSLSGTRSYKDGESYSLKEYFEDLCPSCYLIGINEWLDDGIIYRTIPGEKSTLFLPHLNDLAELSRFKKSYRPLLNKNSRYQNIRKEINSEETENLPGSFSTLLCFYERFFFHADKKEIVGKSWAMIDVPLGRVKNIKLNVVNLSDSILRVIRDLSEKKISIYRDIVSNFLFFYDNPQGAPVNWEFTGRIRENLSKAILFDDFHSFARNLLPRKGGRVGYSKGTRKNLEDLIYLWRLKKMGIQKESLGTIRSAGNIVAKASRRNMSLFYKLEKVRTIDEFWSILREVGKKVFGFGPEDRKMIKEKALDELVQLIKEDETRWKEIRDLLIVYSAMYYSIGKGDNGDADE